MWMLDASVVPLILPSSMLWLSSLKYIIALLSAKSLSRYPLSLLATQVATDLDQHSPCSSSLLQFIFKLVSMAPKVAIVFVRLLSQVVS